MQLGLFLDLDGTIRESTDGKFIQTPKGQRIMAGVHEAIAFHKAQGYTIIGVTNQGGCDTINRNKILRGNKRSPFVYRRSLPL